MKKLDIFLFIIGIVFIIFGGYSLLMSHETKEKTKDPVEEIKKKNFVEENLINTCWNNEVIGEETSSQRKKLICFDETGEFTYKYVDDDETIEGFDGYNKFSYDNSNVITLIKTTDKSKLYKYIYIESISKGSTLVLKYNDRLVYFNYYCRL